ncbi:MAG: aldo/keto reductase [Spirochaetaceae bacterium]|nr:MAG: aldo/keto reductase [Spirochaetaceae bacterium]
MELTQLGTSDLKVSRIALGTDQFGTRVDRAAAKKIIFSALDAGINFIDTAHIYGDGRSEELIGDAIASVRDKVILATKGGHPHTGGPSPKNLRLELETSLQRLKTDHIDLYQVHFIIGQYTPLEDILEVLRDMQTSGKVCCFGASNFYTWQLYRANDLCARSGQAGLVSIQSHYSLLERDIEAELIPYCEHTGVGLLPFYPLAGGLLANRYRRGIEPGSDTRAGQLDWADRFFRYYATERNFDLIDLLSAFAQKRGRSLAELSLAWLLTRPAVCSVIVGASKPEHVLVDSRACDWNMSNEELAEIGSILGDKNRYLRYPRRLWWEVR